jgi:hypothetical protein
LRGLPVPGVPEQWTEFRYRSLFGLTHAQYESEPAETVDWLLAIDGVVAEVKAEKSG